MAQQNFDPAERELRDEIYEIYEKIFKLYATIRLSFGSPSALAVPKHFTIYQNLISKLGTISTDIRNYIHSLDQNLGIDMPEHSQLILDAEVIISFLATVSGQFPLLRSQSVAWRDIDRDLLAFMSRLIFILKKNLNPTHGG